MVKSRRMRASARILSWYWTVIKYQRSIYFVWQVWNMRRFPILIWPDLASYLGQRAKEVHHKKWLFHQTIEQVFELVRSAFVFSVTWHNLAVWVFARPSKLPYKNRFFLPQPGTSKTAAGRPPVSVFLLGDPMDLSFISEEWAKFLGESGHDLSTFLWWNAVQVCFVLILDSRCWRSEVSIPQVRSIP